MNEKTSRVKPLVSHYAPPRCLPPEGVHPRVWVTPASLPRVKATLHAPEHRGAYEAWRRMAETPFPLDQPFAYSNQSLDTLMAKALDYLLLNDSKQGREAIDGVLHALNTLAVPTMNDRCRAFGAVMYATACVYDWCYPLLGQGEHEEIVALAEEKLGPYFEVGYPPEKQGNVTGHGCEAQLLRDWLSLGIAAYDEYPDIYKFVAGRIMEQVVPAHDYYYRSGSHWQGSAYGPYRYRFDLLAEALFFSMTDGAFRLFDPSMEETAITFLYYLRPDGSAMRIGDDFADKGREYSLSGYYQVGFLAGLLYRNPITRGFALGKPEMLDPFLLLLLDDPSVGTASADTLPPVRWCGSPLGQYIARTGMGENDAVLYLKVGESYSANHEHKDAGNFLIYRKGSLVSASNCYEYTGADGSSHRYGTPLDLQYNKQTIAHNCLLVYDPAENAEWGNCGGQKNDRTSNWENFDLADWQSKPTIHWAKTLAHADGTNADGNFDFCTLTGDLTDAYSEKVESYRRTLLATATGDARRPIAFFTFDRVSVREASAKKTYLLHMTDEPQIDGSRVVITSAQGGRLISETLLPKNPSLTAIGGENRQFIVNGRNLAPTRDKNLQPIREDGWGRVEISPTEDAKTELFLHAMLVTDSTDSEIIPATLVEGENAVAALLPFVTAVFPREDAELTSLSITFPRKVDRCFVTGLAAGRWTDGKQEFTVTEEGHLAILSVVTKLSLCKL